MNWTHWSFQALFLIATAGATLHVARVRDARLRLWTLQLTLLACLLLPMLAPTLPSIVIPFDGVVSAPSGIASRVTLTFSPRYVWLLGATVVLSRLLLAMMRVRSLRKQSQPFEQRGAVEIRTSVEVVSPVTFGFLHPLVLLPETARTVEVEVREPMIAHELEHIRRKDWLMVLAEEIIRAAAWFHPAVWWLLSRIRAAREQLIDAAVAQAAGADRYAESLLTAARWRASLRETQPFPAVAMHGGGSLEQRLQRPSIIIPKR